MHEHTHIFITDIGSTTTKGLLLEKTDATYRFIHQVEVPTTVERPVEDVWIGVKNALRKIEEETNLSLLDENDRPSIPYLTTSSAGGGLQMLVFGLTSVDTGKAADLTVLGAGGVILKRFTIDDRIPSVQKMRLIRELHPDLILMAGGIDGGDIANLVRLAEILKLARPTPKFDESGINHLIFCGNTDAREFIARALENNFEIHITENIRPNLMTLNSDPAKKVILDLFMDHVMERAPGYGRVKDMVETDILPTPVGVENMLRVYNEEENENLVMVDIGGATTDIFSNIYGDYRRSVSANLGMSYSCCNVIATGGISGVMDHLPEHYEESEIRDYFANKSLCPTYIPNTAGEILADHAAAIRAVNLAWKQHKDLNFAIAKLGFLDKLRKRFDYDPYQEMFYGPDMSSIFQISDIDLIVGTGGVISHAENEIDALRILVDGFLPVGITRIAVDKTFKSPHLGVLSSTAKDTALDLFKHECLIELGTVIAPSGHVETGKPVLSVTDEKTGERFDLVWGDVRYYPHGGSFTLECKSKSYILNGETICTYSTDRRVMIDCRGRDESVSIIPLSRSGIEAFKLDHEAFRTHVSPNAPELFRGEYRFRRELPYKGDILVKEGESVSPGTIVAENKFTPPRMYILDMQRLVGYDHELDPEEIEKGIIVSAGEEVQIGQRLFKYRGSITGGIYYCHSPVRGRVDQVEKTGLIILREIQDYSLKPKVVNVAQRLQVDPKHIRNIVEYNVGDFIHMGEHLVKAKGRRLPVQSPATGTIKKIDTDEGTVTIQYDIDPVRIPAFVQGTVDSVREGYSLDIFGSGTMIHGVIGFGGESSGPLKRYYGEEAFDWDDAMACVVASVDPVDESFLRRCREKGISGVIVPSIHAEDWIRFYGKEIGVILTGDEDIPFGLLLTEGFGQKQMRNDVAGIINSSIGKSVSISPRTQIRAGVRRPMLIISD